MKKLLAFAMVLACAMFSNPTWAFTVYTDRATFETTNTGLTTEDFETNNLGSVTSAMCPSPLDSNTNNICFQTGDLAAGVEYGLPDTPVDANLGISGPVDALTTRIGPNSWQDFLVAKFSEATTTAVGLDLICTVTPRTGAVRFYGVNGLITEQSVNCSASGDFIAITADETIVRVEAQAEGTFSQVDNVSFGSAFVEPVFMVFTDPTEFQAHNPGLVTEDFENNGLGSSSSSLCPSPLDSTSDNFCFSPGDLAAGVEYGLPSVPVGDKLALSAAVGSVSAHLGANSAGDFLVARFSDPATTAVGLELICTFSPRAGTVRFYGSNGLLTEQSVDCSDTGDFIGIAANVSIVRIEAEALVTFENIDNLMFGKTTVQMIFKDSFE